jgi:transposase
MFIQRFVKHKGDKTYRSAFLTESYREGKKVKHLYLANLSALPDGILDALDKILKGEKSEKGKKGLEGEKGLTLDDLKFIQGKACGGLIVVKEICERLGIIAALGNSRDAQLALVQIMGRVLTQKSRFYIATQWAEQEALKEVLNINPFNEDTLYSNLDWLSENQENIEKSIFNFRHKGKKIKTIYLYDVTSSYLEGTQNELAAYGYNRDKKQGKMQIVIGLLCDEDGYPVSVEVFEGNTQDVTTVTNQLKKLKSKFGVEQVVFVGDRGMVKSASIEEITELSWYYITAITKPQIETLLKQGVFQMDLFSEKLIEVKQDDTRYVLHRNPARASEINLNRMTKIESVKKLVEQKNEYLAEHAKASEKIALNAVQKKATHLKIGQYLEIKCKDRKIEIETLTDKMTEGAQLDGCYVIKSNLPEQAATPATIHDRYKDLAMVEQAFRTMKQAFEEVRPIYVRKEKRTRGHVLVCMLAYMVIKYVWDTCKDLGINQTNIFENLDKIQYIQYFINNITFKTLPTTLSETQTKILKNLKIKLPTHLSAHPTDMPAASKVVAKTKNRK